MSPQVLRADALTVEYDTVRGVDAVVFRPFPNPNPDDDGAWIVGSLDDLRGVFESAAKLVDDLADD